MAIQPSVTNIEAGQSFSVDVIVETGTQPIDLAEVHLDFDPNLLQVVSVIPGAPSLPLPLVAAAFDNVAGTIDYAAGTFSNFPSGTLTLLSIDFIASGTATGSTDITFAFDDSVSPLRITESTYERRERAVRDDAGPG